MLTARIPRLLPELSRAPLTRGCVFGWLPEFGQRDFVGGLVATVGGNVRPGRMGDGTANGKLLGAKNHNFTLNNAAWGIDVACPVSSGDVSWLAICELLNPADSYGTLIGLTNQNFNEHMNDAGTGLLQMGPFASTRWFDATIPFPLNRTWIYAGSMASGVTNGSIVYAGDTQIARSTITTSFPTTIGILRQSSAVGTNRTGIGIVGGLLIWNRALPEQELRAAIRNPAALFRTGETRRSVIIGASAAPSTAPGKLLKAIQHHGVAL